MGAEPYGLGLWNAAFIHELYSDARLRELRAYKAQADPDRHPEPGQVLQRRRQGDVRVWYSARLFSDLPCGSCCCCRR